MMEKESVFKNKMLLELRNTKAESSFNEFLNNQRIKYNKWFSGILLILFIGDIIFQNTVFEQSKQKIPKFAYIIRIVSIIFGFISLILFLLVFSIKAANFQIFISYANFIVMIIPMIDYREILQNLNLVDDDIIILLRTFEMTMRGTMIILVLIAFPHGLYMNLSLFLFACFYCFLIQKYYLIFNYLLSIFALIPISYFFTKSQKETFLLKQEMKEQINWYSNLFAHLHAGFISFGKNNQINLLNKSLIEKLFKNKEIEKIINNNTNNTNNLEQCRLISSLHILNTSADDLKIKEEILKSNSQKVIEILLEGIYKEYSDKDNINISDCKIEFDLQKFLNENMNLYKNKNMNERFLLIGYKDLEVEQVLNSPTGDMNKTKEFLTFEVYLRWRSVTNSHESNEFEFFFYDISNIKKNEEKYAETKYKTMFLSKIAHEFKNPVICISELVSNFQENYERELKDTNNIKIRESFQSLKQIISFADYLLIIIKDLDFYSQLQIRNKQFIEKEIVDIDETLDFCYQLADVLLHKFNKQNVVKFIVENNLTDLVTIITDPIKLKQILTNLISNAIKFTNFGVIRLKLDLTATEDKIHFEVSDTGVGMSEEQLQSLIKPFRKGSGADINYGSGLGLYIVNQMLKQLDSEIKVTSIVGKGSEISFSLPCQVEENKLEESIHTGQIEEEDFNINENSKIQLKYEDEEQEKSPCICFKNKANVDLSERALEVQPQLEPEIQLEPIGEPEPGCSYFILVDDEAFTLKSSARNLKKAAEKINKKVQIFETEDGIECLDLIYKLIKRGFNITAVVSDELMNHMNGTILAEVLKKIKNLNTSQIPFFLLTAYPNIKSKFIDYLLAKPLNKKDAQIILTSKEHFGK